MKRIFLAFLLVVFSSVPVIFVSAKEPIKILLVPGHDDQVWGSQYGNLKEANMNLAVAKRIYNILKKDKKFKVYITRDDNGYKKEFADYFAENKDAILAFKDKAKKEMQDKIKNGEFIERENVYHNTASADVAVILYGINKWANENNMDAVVHIHFNDYPRPAKWANGKYKGFAIYMPDGQLPNSKESGQLAADIFSQLRKKFTASTYEKELGGLVPDQKLIALGSNDTLSQSVRSVLIEYGYIYRFGNKSKRLSYYDDMAGLTATGIKEYFK